MASLQEIRRRIKSVKSTQQITKAMKMVAAARLRRAQEAAVANRPYAEKMHEVISQVAAKAEGVAHPLLQVYEKGKRLYIVIASDKGLAGAYASNVYKELRSHIGDEKFNSSLVTIGRRAKEQLNFQHYDILESFTGFTERPKYENAYKVASYVMEQYTKGGYKEVYLIYTKFISAITAIPETVKLLPFNLSQVDSSTDKQPAQGFSAEYEFEPSAEEVLGHLLPQYVITMLYSSLLQSAASELSSRMNAMSNATDNAQDLIARLDLHYNKVRQAGITREISEIVGGAEALK